MIGAKLVGLCIRHLQASLKRERAFLLFPFTFGIHIDGSF